MSSRSDKALKTIELLQMLYSIIAACGRKLAEISKPGFDPDKVDLKKLRDELLALPDLPRK